MINGHIFRYAGTPTWDDEIAENAKMFLEADKLDAVAYSFIADGQGNAEAWANFVGAKERADAQRTAAYQDWMRIKRQMKKGR